MVDATTNQAEENPIASGGASSDPKSHGLMSGFFSTDHNKTGLSFLLLSLLLLCVAALLGLAVRFTTDGSGMLASLYAGVATLLVVPAMIAGIGSHILPQQVGARTTAIPPLNTVGLLLYALGAVLAFVAAAGAGAGSPYLVAAAIVVLNLSLMVVSINLVLTMHLCRAPNVSWFSIPLASWGIYGSAMALIPATKLIIAATVVTTIIPSYDLGAYNTALGSEAVLFQYVGTYMTYPLAFIFVLPGVMFQADILSKASGRKMLGYNSSVLSCFGVGLIALFGWVVAMILPPTLDLTWVLISFVSLGCTVFILVPILNFVFTLQGGGLTVNTPVVFTMGLFFVFIAACFGGAISHNLSLGGFLQGSAFEVAQNHLFLVGGSVMGLFSGAYFWWGKMTGRVYNDSLGRIGALLCLGGSVIAFLPMLMLGAKGMSYTNAQYVSQFDSLQSLSTVGIIVLAVGVIVSAANLFLSLMGGQD